MTQPMDDLKLTPAAWVTVVETRQGPSEQVNWERMRGIEHRPLYTAEQVHTAIRQAVEADRCRVKPIGPATDNECADAYADGWNAAIGARGQA